MTPPSVCYDCSMQYQASDYADRDALEAAIADKTTETKAATIVGKGAELARLFLAHGDRVWGIAVEQSDYVAPPVFERPQRGELHVFGINKRQHENN